MAIANVSRETITARHLRSDGSITFITPVYSYSRGVRYDLKTKLNANMADVWKLLFINSYFMFCDAYYF